MGRHRVVYGGYIYTDLDGWTKNSLQLGVLILWKLTNINVINNLWVASCSSTKMVMETTRCIIFMYVCMYVCLYVCMDVWMYVCMYVCMYVYIQNYPYRIAPGNLSKSDSGTVTWWSGFPRIEPVKLLPFIVSTVKISHGISPWISTYPIGSMVLVYMLTWLGYIDGDPSWDEDTSFAPKI